MSAGIAPGLEGYLLTRHARKRAAERGIRLEAVDVVLRHGRPVRRERGDQYSLEGVRRPREVSPKLWHEALQVLVIVDDRGSIPTLYGRRRAALKAVMMTP